MSLAFAIVLFACRHDVVLLVSWGWFVAGCEEGSGGTGDADVAGIGLERLASEDLLRGDRALLAAAAEEGDRPIEEHCDPVLEAGQCDQMDRQPQQPGGEARCMDPPEGGDRAEARDSSQRPPVAVAERPLPDIAAKPADDRLRGVAAGLDRHLCDPRQTIKAHQIADHENVRVAG